jgi:hypothetical protein
MKKLFLFFTATVLTFACAAGALATDFSADGRLRLKYVDKDDAAKDSYDALTNLHAKINEEVNLTCVLRAKSGSSDYIDEVYAVYTKPFGEMNLGYFLYSTCGDLAILTQVIDDLQTDFGVSYAVPLKNGFSAKAYYGFGDEDVNANSYALTFGYAKESWGADINVVDSRLRDSYEVSAGDPADPDKTTTFNGDYAKTGLVFNAFYIPIEPLRLYLNYETRDEYHQAQSFQYKDAILGASYSPIEKLTLIGEYNLEKNDQNCHNWGLRANYKITPETTLSLIRTQEVAFDYDEDAFTDTNSLEFRVQINF